jgi:hypothetical protein
VTDPSRQSVSQYSTQGALVEQLDIGVSPRAITKTPEQVLVADGDMLTVTGIDTNAKIVGSFTYPETLEVTGSEHAPGPPSAFLSTPDDLWIAFGNIGQVMRLAPSGTYLGLTRVPTGPLSLAWSGSELWAASADAGTVTRISGDGAIIATHDVGGRLTGIAHDGERGWVVDEDKDLLVMLTPVVAIAR